MKNIKFLVMLAKNKGLRAVAKRAVYGAMHSKKSVAA